MKKILFLFLALFALAFAHGGDDSRPSEGLKANVMHTQYEKSACRVDYYVNALQHVKDEGLNISVDDVLTSLNVHKGDLEAAADAADREAFNTAHRALKDDIRGVEDIYHQLKQMLHGNESREARKELRDFLESEKNKRNECIANSSKNLGEAQSEYVRAWREDAKNLSAKLRNKSVDTHAMDNIIEEAERDGDVNASEHLRFWARFHVARLEALLDAVDEKAVAAGLSSQVDEIKALLGEANGKITMPFEKEEFKDVKELIKEAHSKLKELVKDIRDGAKAQKKAEKELTRNESRHEETESEDRKGDSGNRSGSNRGED